MEDVMASLTDRQKARERLRAAFEAELNKLIPADESLPLRGGKFIEWEDQADELEQTLCSTFLEERAALESSAQVDCGGRCPYCSSTRVYLIKQAQQVEVRTPHGPVVLHKQRCRCRSCDRSFSPSRAGLGVAARGAAQSQGGEADRAGGGVPEL
jgi:hypothetical protein